MELGSPPRLLQPRVLGGMGKSLSPAAALVSPATSDLCQPPWLWWKLALPSEELSSAQTRVQARLWPSSVPTGEQTGLSSRDKSSGIDKAHPADGATIPATSQPATSYEAGQASSNKANDAACA